MTAYNRIPFYFDDEYSLMKFLHGEEFTGRIAHKDGLISGPSGDHSIDFTIPGRQDYFNPLDPATITKGRIPERDEIFSSALIKEDKQIKDPADLGDESDTEGKGADDTQVIGLGACGGFLPALLPIIGTLAPIVAPLIIKGLSWIFDKLRGKKEGSGAEDSNLTKKLSQAMTNPSFLHNLKQGEARVMSASGGNFLSTLLDIGKSILGTFLPGILGSGFDAEKLASEAVKATMGHESLTNLLSKNPVSKKGGSVSSELSTVGHLLKPLIQHGIHKAISEIVKHPKATEIAKTIYKLIKQHGAPMLNESADFHQISGEGYINAPGGEGEGFKNIHPFNALTYGSGYVGGLPKFIEWIKEKGRKFLDFIKNSKGLRDKVNMVLSHVIKTMKTTENVDRIAKFIDESLQSLGVSGEWGQTLAKLFKQGIQFVPDKILDLPTIGTKPKEKKGEGMRWKSKQELTDEEMHMRNAEAIIHGKPLIETPEQRIKRHSTFGGDELESKEAIPKIYGFKRKTAKGKKKPAKGKGKKKDQRKKSEPLAKLGGWKVALTRN